MSKPHPVIRLRSNGGLPLARDGVVLTFFMHRNHEEVFSAVWHALQTYLRAVPPRSLNWYDADDGDTLALDDKGWEVIRERMFERPWKLGCSVELSEDACEGDIAGGYQFEYYGRRLDDPFWKDPATAVSFTFPTEYLMEHGPDHLRALAFKLAWELPFSFGYASLAIVAPYGYSSTSDWDLLYTLRDRYLGLDLYDLRHTASVIGTHARSASWLTFIGQPLLGQLGGIEGLRHALPFPEVTLLPLDSQRLLITLSEWPEAIDIQEGGIPPQYRALALRLKPFLYKEPSDWPSSFLYQWLQRLSR